MQGRQAVIFGYGYPRISADTIAKVRRACHEYQRDFAQRFGVTKRTIIRCEQNGCEFRSWDDAKSKPWKALREKHPKLFTKAERELIRG